MRNRYFNIVVKKILKYKNKLIGVDKLKLILTSIMDQDYSDQKLYKMIYYLKNRGHLLNLKKDIYFVKGINDTYSDETLIENYYWAIVKKHCKEYLMSDRYVGGFKSLELNMSGFDAVDDLLIVNRAKQSQEVLMFNKKVIYKKYYADTQALFKLFFKFTKKIYIKGNSFNIAGLELSLLESLYNPPSISESYINELVKKAIRKYKNNLDFKIREKILMNNKHHSSINRLYKLVLSVDPELSEKIKNIIKRYSYFIDV